MPGAKRSIDATFFARLRFSRQLAFLKELRTTKTEVFDAR
jgi:hypothetical protein